MWIHVLGEQTQPSAHEQLLNIKTLPLAQEVPELHIAGTGPQYIQFRKAKLDIFLFSQALLEMCYETVKEAACKAGQSFSPTQAAHAQVPHRDLKGCSLLCHPWGAVLYRGTQLLRATHWLLIFACLNYIYPIKIYIQIISNCLSFIHFGLSPHLFAKLRKIQEKICHHIYTFF